MSYILDSLKKSDKERRSMDTPASIVMRSPAFLENDKKQAGHKWLIIAVVIVALLAVAYYLFPHFKYESSLDTLSEISEKKSETPKQKIMAQPAVKEKPVSSKEKEQAVLLYKQALANKSRPEVDSLYQKLNKDTEATVATSPVGDVGSVAKSLDTKIEEPIENASVETVDVVSEKTTEPSAKSEPKIPSIYEIDAYVRKTIPSVDYGAHIYATDNNSGFVILDGARRRAGDKLDSGLYVEKIEEESVVLSYEGTLFSLPAMKSWQGN